MEKDQRIDPADAHKRGAANDDGLSEWFVPTEEVPVPEGFASRVASLAFAGGDAPADDLLVPAGPGGTPPASTGFEQGRILSFTMSLAAAAAAAVLVFTLVLAGGDTGDATGGEGGISADTKLDEKLDQLEAENRELELEAATDEEPEAK